ncbi:thioesterase [Serratia marcescens]|uniref:thioesterase II family protein n=1 Tax=Serratia marcescens TaxID=615 RepID=UPI001C5811E2|nr:alpha/beta fold hydrolase [Serratia marcescens]QXX95822.1 thioesterase [Serratia marcescens]
MREVERLAQTDWLAHKLTRDGRLNLLCFPYAGGTSALFSRWRPTLPDWVNICPLVFPGRESRHRQPHESHFVTLADKIAEALLPQLRNVNFALYGHSMGAWFAHDLALRACRQATPPRGLLVSGQRAPQFAYPFGTNREIDDATLLKLIDSFGGLDAELLANSSWTAWMLGLMRADLSLCETHPPVAPDVTLSCPLHLFANDADPLLTLDAQRPWQFRTRGRFSLSQHQGGHFFIRTHAADFLKKLASVLAHISPSHQREE